MHSTTFYLRWYKFGIILMIVMVAVGGITRLTDSGLSMVDWKPIFGVIPPLSDADWESEFSNYKSFPEFQKINSSMDIAGFKRIYFWEYLHRIIGRIIGLYFFLPLIYLLIRRKINRNEFLKNTMLIFLVGIQGVLGWYMVKSGLVNSPHVSHFRLMTHFFAAMILIGYCYYLYLDKKEKHPYSINISNMHLRVFSFILLLQIMYGTFVAGLNAGYAYNTFPLMSGKIIPYELFSGHSLLGNLFLSPYPIQYIHRVLGTILLLYSFYFIYSVNKVEKLNIYASLEIQLSILIGLQFLLGVLTLLLSVPIPIAILHQVNTCFIVLKCIELYYYSLNQ